jgi:endonuclease-3
MIKMSMQKIFEIFRKNNPEPKTELDFKNEYTLLVAIVMSAQTTDIQVNKATAALFKIADTPKKMVKLGEENLKKYIKTIGLFNSKAKNVIALSKILIEEYGSKVPSDEESLIKLPGVGSKTANVFLNCWHKIPTIAVDTHVFRVSNRLGLVKTKTADETQKKLNKIVPDEFKLHAHHWLILHGRYVCKARNPECEKCEVSKFCKKVGV